MAKIIEFFDGAQTVSVPTIGSIAASALLTYANDAAFEAANGPGTSGDVYINTTLNVLRYWDNGSSSWKSLLSSSSTVDAINIADGSVTNTEFQYINSVTSNVQTQLTDNASDISDVASDLTDHTTSVTAHSALSIVNVPSGNLSATDQQTANDELQTDIDSRIPSSEKGAVNGVASLDGGGKVPAAQLPNTVMELQGFWNASTNTPTLADGVGNPGDIYEVNTAGTANLGSGNITFAIGDWAVYAADNIWHKSINSNAVASVNSMTGNVTLDTGDISEDTNLYFTDERAQDAVGGIVQNTTTINMTYADGTPSITAAVNDDSISNSKLSDMATQTFKGRTSGGTGDPEDLTATQATAMLDTFTSGLKGLAPLSGGGTANFLRADGTWAAPSGGASTALDNLTTTNINEDFLFNKASALVKTKDIAASNTLTVKTGDGTSTTSGAYSSGSGNATTTSGTAALATGTGTSTGATNITTGNASAGGSGNINLTTGTATTTRGSIVLSANGITTNTSITPTTDGAVTIGGFFTNWAQVYTNNLSSNTGNLTVGSNINTTYTATFTTGDLNSASATGVTNIKSGSNSGAGNTGNIAIATGTPSGGTRGSITAAATSFDMSSVSAMTLVVPKTVTGGGTTGAQTINKISGTVNFAAAAASLVVTNSTVTANSIVLATIRTNDATMTSVQAVPAAGSFTLYPNAVPTAETSVGFLVIN
jgi:HAMP domain-containing protein